MTTLLLTCLLAAASGKPALDETSTSPSKYPIAVTITSHPQRYRQVVHSIKEIDFKNLNYNFLGERIRLRNGSMRGTARPLKGEESPPRLEVTLKWVRYFDLQDGRPLHALISVEFFSVSGSSSDREFVLLFGIMDSHPVIEQQFDYDLQALGAGDAFDEKTGILTIKARAQDGSPHCCPQNLEADEFKWQGQRFTLMDRKIMSVSKSTSH